MADSTVENVWREVSSYVRENVSETLCSLWLDRTVPLELGDDYILLGVENDFFSGMMLESMGKYLEETLTRITGKKLEIRFENGHVPPSQEPESEPEPVDPDPGETIIKKELEKVAPNCQKLNVFETFVVGEENRYAFTAAQRVAQSPGEAFNPLYIYGGPGLGKTHLIQAIATDVVRRNASAEVCYISCENFLNRYVEALGKKTPNAFREAFRNVDMLLIDDVHQLSGKNQLQEEFFNTFNTLYNAGKQIVLTSDKRP